MSIGIFVIERFLASGMLPIVFCCLLSSILSVNPAHLKSSALSAHLGLVTLVEDVLWVRNPLTGLVGVLDLLTAVTEHLTAFLSLLEKDLAGDVNESMLLFRLFHARVEFVNGTLSLALYNYSNFPRAHRPKRGLLDGIGQLSRMIFGTTMNKDVEELRGRYNHLVSLASAQNKAIISNSRNIARLEQQMHDVASATLRTSLNAVLTSLNNLYAMEVIGQALPALEIAVNSLLRTTVLLIRNVIDAALFSLSMIYFRLWE